MGTCGRGIPGHMQTDTQELNHISLTCIIPVYMHVGVSCSEHLYMYMCSCGVYTVSVTQFPKVVPSFVLTHT